MAKRNVSEIEGAESFIDFVSAMIGVVREKVYPFVAIYRLATAGGSTAFSAPVVYLQPELEELKRRFPAYVNPDYQATRFDPIERCKTVSKENREVAFEYVHMDRYASTDEVLAEFDRKRLRPALYEELLGFDEKYPDEQRKHPIVALGSGTDVRGRRRVAYLWYGGLGRHLNLHWIDDDWLGNCRFLAVRK
ncbi:MAG: hypothetical protein PHS79_04460 [Patescibacteria group bacterium]|nr:hypothetical protein [Patescibacteria group bacterium]